jgi:hypothetical protein
MVRAFAARALNDNPGFCSTLSSEILKRLLCLDGEAAFSFALVLVKDRLAAGHIEGDLLPVLFETERPEALELAQSILSLRPELVSQNCKLAARLILSVTESSHQWLSSFWAQHASETNLPYLFADIVAEMRSRGWSEETEAQDKQRLRLSADLLSQHFLWAIENALLEQMQELANLPGDPAKMFAVLIAAHRPDRLQMFDPAVLAQSEDDDLRAAGAELLAHATIEELRQHEDLVVAFLLSPVAHSRKAARSAVLMLAADDAATAQRLIDRLLPVLYRAEESEGVREDLAETMQGPLLAVIVERGADLVWKLLRARSEPARRVGTSALQGLDEEAFSLRKIARIGNNDQLKARQWALMALEQRISEVQAKPNEIFSLLDGEWDDSREAAYDLVRNRLEPEHWTPEAVVGLCDSISLPAQEFGREILGTVFAQENAPFFLMRLSEHPSAGFRLTIARLIREYAAGNHERIGKLQFAIKTILSRVFSSRSAKDQIYTFIETEIANGDPQTLDILAGLLTDLSASCAIGDKARVLSLVTQLKAKTPELVAPARIVEPEIRQKGKVG